MDQTNTNMLYHSDFFDAVSLSEEPQAHTLIWWGFAIIETLLFARLISGYFDASLTSPFTYIIYTITQYILYPFTATLTSVGHGFVTVAAIAAYFLVALTLTTFLKISKSPRSGIERARALSRRKYSR